MATGVIRKKLDVEGYGFIQEDGAAADESNVFFHRTSCEDGSFGALQEGDRVTFEHGVARAGKGPRADNVRKE